MESGNSETIKVDVESIIFPVKGIYKTHDGNLPSRLLYMHEGAIADFYRLQKSTDFNLVYSDIFRKPESSFLARKSKGAMVAPPGKSGHNYGLSFDVDVEKAIALLTTPDNPRNVRILRLQDYFASYNWYPLRSVRDKLMKKNKPVTEEWHFNHGHGLIADWIEERYGKITLSVEHLQGILIQLGYNAYPVDGIFGRQTQKALKMFQKDCRIKVTGRADHETSFILSALRAEYIIKRGAAAY